MRIRALALGLLLPLGSIPAAQADQPTPGAWRSYGPAVGGQTLAVGFQPSEPLQAYAVVNTFGATEGSLYRTTDGGVTWSPTTFEGLPNAAVFAPDNFDVGYAGSSDGLFQTQDGGASWTELAGGLPESTNVRSLAIDPTTASIVYAGTDAGLYTTVDGGASWTRSSSGLPEDAQARRIVISPADPSTIYYTVWQTEAKIGRLFRSTDRGATWTSTPLSSKQFIALAVAPSDASTLYAATSEEGLRVSHDGGSTWLDLPSAPAGTPWTIAVHPGSPQKAYLGTTAGAFLTANGGATWTALAGLSMAVEVHALAISPVEPSKMLAGTCCYTGGIYRSEDAGSSWQIANEGLDGDSNIWSLTAGPSGVLYAGANGGASTELSMFRGTAGGRHWLPRDEGIPPDVWVRAVAVSPADPDVAFAAAGTLYGTTDGGRSWSARTLPNLSTASSVAVAPSNPQVVYVGGTNNGLAQGSFGAAVFKSVDGGSTWTLMSKGLLPTGDVADLEVDPRDPDVVYAATGNTGVFKSTDGGATWLNHRAGIRSTGVIAIAIDPVNPDILYAGGSGTTVTAGTGVYKSTNGGLLWLPTGLVESAVSSIAIDPTDTRRVFATQYKTGARVMMSTDAGATWSPMMDDIEPDLIVPNIAIDPSGDRLYASSGGRGVLVAEI